MPVRTWMLVEDDIALRTMLVTMITVMWDNLDVLAFKDGYEAMHWLDRVETEKAATSLPELALLDIRMPGPQGHEIAERLRNLVQTANMTIVMMTAFRFDPVERALIEKMAQPNLFINKPLPGPHEFKILLDKTLAKRSAA